MAREIELPENTQRSAIEDGVVFTIDDVATEEGKDVAVPEPKAPTTEDAESQDGDAKSGEKEEASKTLPAWITDDNGAIIEYGKPVLGKGTHKLPPGIVEYLRGVGIGSLNQPIEHTLVRYSEEGHEPSGFELTYEHVLPLALPMVGTHDRLSRPGSIWTNDVVAEGLSTKVTGVRPKGEDIVNIFRSQNSLGQATEWTFYNTGIIIRMRPALDSELIGLENVMMSDRTMVGQQTWGALLSADMGVHMNHLIDFALSLVTWTNLVHEGDMRAALRSKLRGRESIDILLAAALASMYPHGYPWEVHCHAAGCGASEKIDVFFARAQITDKSLLTDFHMNVLHRNRQSLPEDRYVEYMEKLPHSVREVEHNGSVFKLRMPSIGDYAMATRRWVNVIETENIDALEKFDNPNQRDAFLEVQASSRTLLSISHYIGSVTIDNGSSVTEVTDRSKIEEILHVGSADLPLVALLMAEVAAFELDSRTTFIGHDNRDCPSCNATIRNQSGPWASVVILPVERIFFMHTRQKIQILHGLRERQ